MPEIQHGVMIRYDAIGEGRPLILLHGWSCDRSWWTIPGYVEDLRTDHHLANVDIRGHGESDKPHDAAAYTAEHQIGDVLAVADAEGMDRFAIWGQSYGGWIAWMTAAAVPGRVAAIVTTGEWDPRPLSEVPTERPEWFNALVRNGTSGLVEQYRIEDGDRHDVEFPPWARDITLRADPEALIASNATELLTQGIPNDELGTFPVPALLIAGELEDEDDDAATIAATIPNGQRLRVPGLGHGGTAQASAVAIPTAREFLERWFPWPASTPARTP